MEEKILPEILQIFDEVTSTWKKMAKVQESRMDLISKGKQPDAATKYCHLDLIFCYIEAL